MKKLRSGKTGKSECSSQFTEDDVSSRVSSESATSTKATKIARRKPKAPAFKNKDTRLSLLSAIKDPNNRKSWGEFFDLYSSLIKSVGRRMGLDKDESDDLVMEVLADMNNKILKFDKTKGKFHSWLRTIAIRRAMGLWRPKERFPILLAPNTGDGSRQEDAFERMADPEDALGAAWDAEEAKAILKLANAITKQSVSLKQWQLFECRILRQWSVERMSETLGITPNAVYLVVHKVRPVYDAAIIEAKERLDRGPLSPLDKKALAKTLALPTRIRTRTK